MTRQSPVFVRNALEQVAQYGTPPRGAAHIFDIGSDAFKKYFEEEILDTLIRYGGATCKLLEGPYGSGKTHLLDLLHDSAVDRGMAVLRTDLSQALGLENWQLVTKHLLENIELEIDGAVHRSLPGLLEAFSSHDDFDLSHLRHATLPHPGFATAMDHTCRGQMKSSPRELVHSFLRGQRVSLRDLEAYGAPRGIRGSLSARNAEAVVKTVLHGLSLIGVPGTLLLFDESESTFVSKRSVPARRVVLGANLLRRLIDSCASGGLVAAGVVFAVLPGFITHCAHAYPALGQRVHAPQTNGRWSWRWPWLRVDTVAPHLPPDAFVDGAAQRFTEVAGLCGGRTAGLQPTLALAGRDVITRHAGTGYRRPVIKRMATLALSQLE